MNFWDVHGVIFVIALLLFPRLTMLFTNIVLSFGPLGWLGWVFAPYLTIAVLATTNYWHTNPVLCVIAWLVAIGGTTSESKTVSSAASGRKK